METVPSEGPGGLALHDRDLAGGLLERAAGSESWLLRVAGIAATVAHARFKDLVEAVRGETETSHPPAAETYQPSPAAPLPEGVTRLIAHKLGWWPVEAPGQE